MAFDSISVNACVAVLHMAWFSYRNFSGSGVSVPRYDFPIHLDGYYPLFASQTAAEAFGGSATAVGPTASGTPRQWSQPPVDARLRVDFGVVSLCFVWGGCLSAHFLSSWTLCCFLGRATTEVALGEKQNQIPSSARCLATTNESSVGDGLLTLRLLWFGRICAIMAYVARGNIFSDFQWRLLTFWSPSCQFYFFFYQNLVLKTLGPTGCPLEPPFSLGTSYHPSRWTGTSPCTSQQRPRPRRQVESEKRGPSSRTISHNPFHVNGKAGRNWEYP